ncbi:MAG: hypothetical protein L3J45_00090 [Flavobacteriaceae bacterium]|nr:hypothetical protein [Flavobacteriaceae bacterium]
MKKTNKHIDIEALDYKNAGFSIPKDYFENIEDTVLAKINSDIPAGYFDSIEDKVFAKLESREKLNKTVKVISFKSKVIKRFVPLLAAASLVLFIGLSFFNKSEKLTFESLETSSISSWFESETGVVDTYALGELLNNDDISSLTNTNTIEDSQLLDYLDNINLEDYILNN